MATDYTVIEAVRQHFGDDPTGDIGVKGQDWHEWLGHQEVPFVGLAKDFAFGCPAVDRTEWAVLQLLTYGVTYDNVIKVNGVDVPGGLSLGGLFPYIDPHLPLWKTESLLIEPGALGEENVLHIESGTDDNGNHDDFLIDNVVIWFKTTNGGDGSRPTVGGAKS
jgi:hypothetical protein